MKEIRIRNVSNADHKRIMLAAREDDVSAGYFCMCAALNLLDRRLAAIADALTRVEDAAKRRTQEK